MNKNFLLYSGCCLLLGLGFPRCAFAQTAFGLQGGLNMSNATVDGPTPFVTSSQGNFFVGITARHPLHRRWALNGDAQYTKRGFFLYQVHSQPENQIAVQLTYLDLAPGAEYNVFKNISLQLGSYLGYRLTERDQLIGSEEWKALLPITDHWDLGLQAGAIARFQHWAAFFRYSHGLKAIARVEIAEETGPIKIFNRGLQIGASYAFF